MSPTHKTFTVRLFEILPGLLTWLTFTLPFALAFRYPKAISLVVMIYALYWLFKTIIMSFHLISGYRHYKAAMSRDWQKELADEHSNWQKVIQLIFVPMYKEDLATVSSTFDALAQSNYPTNLIIPILCTEARAGAEAEATAKAIKQKYGNHFKDFYVTVHPDGIVGEVKGKGANITHAAREVVPLLLAKGYSPSDILVTTLDADNRVDKQYLSCVTKAFLESDRPKYCSYQPLPMYFNNIWDVPLFIRMIALGSSFWVMVQATRPHRLRNFSAHSQSLTGLMESDYWSVQTIVEDGHQYWRSLYKLKGKHHVIPIFVPIYQDAVLSHGFWGTVKEQYLQKRRWAWGVSDIAYVFEHNRKDHSMSFWEKWKQFLILFEGHYSWSTTSLVLAFAGWPPLLINAEFQRTVFAYNFPLVHSKILLAASLGMIISLAVSTLILPPAPARYKRRRLIMIRDWLLTPIILPVTNIFLGALPAIDAQTRLMFGRYMEFRVTVKKALPTATPLPTAVSTAKMAVKKH